MSESCATLTCRRRRRAVRMYYAKAGRRLLSSVLQLLVSSMLFSLSLGCYSKQVAKPTSGGNEDSGRNTASRSYYCTKSRAYHCGPWRRREKSAHYSCGQQKQWSLCHKRINPEYAANISGDSLVPTNNRPMTREQQVLQLAQASKQARSDTTTHWTPKHSLA